MSLSDIFDPVVRAWAKNYFGGESSGGDTHASGVFIFDTDKEYEFNETLGYRISDQHPTESELNGAVIVLSSAGNAPYVVNTILANDGGIAIAMPESQRVMFGSVPSGLEDYGFKAGLYFSWVDGEMPANSEVWLVLKPS